MVEKRLVRTLRGGTGCDIGHGFALYVSPVSGELGVDLIAAPGRYEPPDEKAPWPGSSNVDFARWMVTDLANLKALR